MNDLAVMEAAIRRFEKAWQSGVIPEICNFIPKDVNESQRNKLATELVCVDLEYRWKHESNSQKARHIPLEAYAELFDHFPVTDLPVEIIAEEYRVRRLSGNRPSHTSVLEKFPGRTTEITEALKHVDSELQTEKQPIPSTTSARVNSNDSRSQNQFATENGATRQYEEFILEKMIGSGRMGRVYRAWDKTHDHPVAVKYLRKTFQENREPVKRFIKEAKTVSQFNHPGIIKTTGLGNTPSGGYFIVMELIEGPDLSTAIATGSTSIKESVKWTIQLCQALEHAHAKGIIHCDLKPANLLLDSSRNIRVTDFGLARSTYSEEQGSDRIEGTAAYMAPEQISRWWGSISPQTDVYGAGAVLFNLLTGQAPFAGTTLGDILSQVVSGMTVTPPIQLRPELPVALNSICTKCLSKKPGDRYSSIGQLRKSLEVEIKA